MGSKLLCRLTLSNEIKLCVVKIGAGLREDLELLVLSAGFKNSNFCFCFLTSHSSLSTPFPPTDASLKTILPQSLIAKM